MPHATGPCRGQALHHGRKRCERHVTPPAAPAHSSSRMFRSHQQSNAAHHPPRGPLAKFESRRVRGRVHAVVRLRATFSPLHTIRLTRDDLQPTRCLPLSASIKVRPSTMAGDALITRPRDPPTAAPSISEGLYRNSNLTPRITRPPTTAAEHDRRRVAGRVHALVRLRLSLAHPAP